MMTIEIKINGKPIHTFSVYNKTENQNVASYSVVEGGEGVCLIHNFERNRGAIGLAAVILRHLEQTGYGGKTR